MKYKFKLFYSTTKVTSLKLVNIIKFVKTIKFKPSETDEVKLQLNRLTPQCYLRKFQKIKSEKYIQIAYSIFINLSYVRIISCKTSLISKNNFLLTSKQIRFSKTKYCYIILHLQNFFDIRKTIFSSQITLRLRWL